MIKWNKEGTLPYLLPLLVGYFIHSDIAEADAPEKIAAEAGAAVFNFSNLKNQHNFRLQNSNAVLTSEPFVLSRIPFLHWDKKMKTRCASSVVCADGRADSEWQAAATRISGKEEIRRWLGCLLIVIIKLH